MLFEIRPITPFLGILGAILSTVLKLGYFRVVYHDFWALVPRLGNTADRQYSVWFTCLLSSTTEYYTVYTFHSGTLPNVYPIRNCNALQQMLHQTWDCLTHVRHCSCSICIIEVHFIYKKRTIFWHPRRQTVRILSNPRHAICIDYSYMVYDFLTLSGEIMMSLLWYYRPEHTEAGRRPDHIQVGLISKRNICFALMHGELGARITPCFIDKLNH